LQVPKCALCISNKHFPPSFTYFCDDQLLQWSNVVKYLGVHFNRHLTWTDHCKFVCSKATKVLNLLCRLLFCCCQYAKSHSYCGALVLLLIQYSCPVWLPLTTRTSIYLKLFRIKLFTGFVAVILIFLPLCDHRRLDPAFLILLGLLFTDGSPPYHCYFYVT